MRRKALKSSLTFWVALCVPILAVLFLVSGTVLAAYSPLNYAPNFTDPHLLVAATSDISFGAGPERERVGLAYTNGSGSLMFRLVSPGSAAGGKALLLDHSGQAGEESVASNGGRSLVVWVQSVGQANSRLLAEDVGAKPARRIVIAPANGNVEHPYVFAAPHDRLDVVFSWQRDVTYDVYLASVSAKTGKLLFVKRLARAIDYAFLPRAQVDGSGKIDLMWMDFCCDASDWQVLFRRFSEAGNPLAAFHRMSYIPELGSSLQGQPPVEPSSWGLAMAKGRQGTVWAAWVANESVTLYQWNSHGIAIHSSVLSPGLLNNGSSALSLLPTSHGGLLFATSQNGSQTSITSARFEDQGQPGKVERAEYVTGATVQSPLAIQVGSESILLWDQTGDSSVLSRIEDSIYRRTSAPPVLARLGLNVGNPALGVTFLVFGAAMGAAALTFINIGVLVPLIIVWYPVARIVRPSWQWAVYLGVLTLALVTAFAFKTVVSKAVMVIPPFQSPYGWIVVGGGAFCGYWIGRRTMSNQEAVLRAATTAIGAIYFVAFMWALTGIEGGLGQI